MFSHLTYALKNAKRAYHSVMHAYHSVLYRDCLDDRLKERYYKKARYHRQKMNDRA